jgi:chromosome segregation ATPase
VKLTRLYVNQFKQFRQPLEIDQLTDGINLFVGPNESGKSTLVRAIRAAFFERYKSSSVDDLQPWGDSSATPQVELEFDWQGTHWKLHKQFLKKQRCNLYIGQQHFSEDEAEEKLAELLGYQMSSRGASKPEHWGIPGLLWVEQGCIQDIHHSVDHAGHHLKSALSGTLGDVTTSAGDELINKVESQRAELLTKTGKPTGQYQKILADCDDYQTKLAELDEKIQRYRAAVDRLGELQRLRDEHDSQKPWQTYREQAKTAEAALAAVQALQTEQQRDQQSLRNCESNLEICLQQLRDFEQRTQQLTAREQEKTKTARAYAECQQLTAQLQQRKQQAEQEFQKAKTAVKTAREQLHRRNLQQEHDRLNAHLRDLQSKHKTAAELHNALQALRAQLQAQALDDNQLVQLKKLHSQLNEIRIQEQAIATRLQYQLDAGKTITIGKNSVTGNGEELLLQNTTVEIPGVGTLRVQPGGKDVNELLRNRERLEGECHSALQRLKVQTFAEAEERAAHNQQLAAQIDQHKTRLEILAPQGVDALHSDVQLAEQKLQKISTDLAELPATTSELNEREVEAALATADAALKAAEQADNEHQRELALRQRACESAEQEWQKLQAEIQSPDRQTRERETLDRLNLLKAEAQQLQNALEQRKQKIDSANPAILQQDITRFKKSADALEKEATQRAVEISTLQIQLETLGAQGLEETRNDVQQQLEHLFQRRHQLQHRAEALDLLLNLLREKRQILTRQLQAPLQKHLNHYLNLLFPEATITVDENLRPEILNRRTDNAHLDHLSFGAREQMGLISRLAYADLLKAAGRPTLIILDDALVHCDGERLEQMKRVLFDAGERHQVLLFSCHPERWRGLGVVGRGVQKG